MRKRYKKKLRCCAMCKPHKRKKEKRWTNKSLATLRRHEREIRSAC